GTKWGDGLIEIGWTTPSDIPGVTSYRKHKLNKARLFPCTEEGFQSAATEGVLQSGRGSNVYVGIALRKPDTAPFARTSDDDAYCYTAIVFDLDDPGRAESAKNIWRDMPPTLVVMTGMHPYARMQGWYRFLKPSDDFETFTKFQTALVGAFDGDKKVINPSRVMRLAGSIAHPAKPDRITELAYIHELKTKGSDISPED